MSKVEEQFLTRTRFTKLIEGTVAEKKIPYMDAVIHVCEKNQIEVEDIKRFISPVIKDKIEAEAMNLNFLPKKNSIDDAFKMWSKVVDLFNYNSLNLHENTYLITTILTFGIIIIYNLKIFIDKTEYRFKKLMFVGDIIFISVIFYLTFIFLRPINQFIYFQF